MSQNNPRDHSSDFPAGAQAGRSVPVALTVAGFDPSSGAGVTADLKTFAAQDVYGVACITALTVQSTQGVARVEPVAPALIRETLEWLRRDVEFAGIKLGMLATAGAVEAVCELLDEMPRLRSRTVLDPVIRSSSGRPLLDDAGLERLRTGLLGRVGWVTPNLHELELLTGTAVPGREEIPGAARRLRALAAGLGNPGLCVAVTGGHLDRPDDFLLAGDAEIWLGGSHVETRATHGTGCAFASALLSSLIAGYGAEDAMVSAKAYVTAALRSAYPVGKGHGPMHHLFRLASKTQDTQR